MQNAPLFAHQIVLSTSLNATMLNPTYDEQCCETVVSSNASGDLNSSDSCQSMLLPCNPCWNLHHSSKREGFRGKAMTKRHKKNILHKVHRVRIKDPQKRNQRGTFTKGLEPTWEPSTREYIQVVPGRAGGGSFRRKRTIYIAKKEFAYRMCARRPTCAMPKSFLCCERAFCCSMVVMRPVLMHVMSFDVVVKSFDAM